jgi:hypothetical protein
VHTGADANIVRDGRVHENWTFVSDGRCRTPDPDASTPEPTDATVLDAAARRWIDLRNGGDAEDLVSQDVEIFTGGDHPREVRGRSALTDLIAQRSGTSTLHRDPILDAARGRVAVLRAEDTSTALDLLTLRAGRIAQIWSLTGPRAFVY